MDRDANKVDRAIDAEADAFAQLLAQPHVIDDSLVLGQILHRAIEK